MKKLLALLLVSTTCFAGTEFTNADDMGSSVKPKVVLSTTEMAEQLKELQVKEKAMEKLIKSIRDQKDCQIIKSDIDSFYEQFMAKAIKKLDTNDVDTLHPILHNTEYLVGQIPQVEDLISGLDPNKYYVDIENIDEINENEIGEKKAVILVTDENGGEHRYTVMINHRGIKSSSISIYYKTGKFILSDENMQMIRDLLKSQNILKIQIEGHTDKVGSRRFNQRLSVKRAKQVYGYVKNVINDPKLDISYKGLGETSPISNDNALNRVVVLKIFY